MNTSKRIFRMRRRLLPAAFAAALAWSPAAAHAQAADSAADKPLTLAQVAAKALENDPAVRASRAAAETARVQYRLKLDEARPKFTLGLTPFSYDQRRSFSVDSETFSGPPPYDIYADTNTLSAGGGLSYQQLLPTAGSLEAGVKSSFKAVNRDGELEYDLAPSLSASIRQPLLAGGQFLPTAAAAASRRSVSIASDQASLDDLARRNQAVRGAVDLAGRVLILRATLETQTVSLETARGRVETAILRRRGGTVTEDAALELELAAETLRAGLEETRMALRDAERRLAGVLGLPEAPALSPEIPVLSGAEAPEIRNTPDSVRAALVLDKLGADSAARSILDAPAFGANFTMEPRYPDSRSDADNLSRILSDYFDGREGAGVNLNLTLTLDVPLSAREAKTLRSRTDALAAETARANLELALQAASERAAALVERRAFLADRAAIQRRIADLSRRKWERLTDLVAAGTALPEDADGAKAEWDRAESDILRTELDRILAEMDIRALRGEDLAKVISGEE